jgi:hypothetical protein
VFGAPSPGSHFFFHAGKTTLACFQNLEKPTAKLGFSQQLRSATLEQPDTSATQIAE